MGLSVAKLAPRVEMGEKKNLTGREAEEGGRETRVIGKWRCFIKFNPHEKQLSRVQSETAPQLESCNVKESWTHSAIITHD